MERIKSTFTTYQFDVEVVTPVHVGMAQEKHYMPGLDFVQQGSTLTFLNADSLFKALLPEQLDKVTADMAAGKFSDLNTYLGNLPVIKDPDVRLREETIDTLSRNIREIRRAYVSGLGQPTLPGTSLKGAIRSVLVWHLTRNHIPQADNWGKMDEALFGPITANLMRYLQLSDICFGLDALRVFPVKVFSGDGNPTITGDTKGQWKHGNPGNHDPSFEPDFVRNNKNGGFLNFYESLRPGQKSELRVSLGNQLAGEWLGTVPHYGQRVEQLTGSELVRLIREHTNQYLTKERRYYELFDNDDLNVNARRSMQERLQELEELNKADNCCLLRVGANVGFHSITGDWQSASWDHFSKWAGTAIKYKTRKFDVVTNPERDFLLPGFLKLTLVAEKKSNETRFRTERRMVDFGQAFTQLFIQKEQRKQERVAEIQLEEQKKLEDEQRRQLERKTAIHLNRAPREKRDEIEAVVISSTPKIQVQLYVKESYKPIFEVRYAYDAKVGDVVIVTANVITKKGEIKDISVKRLK